MRNKAGKNVVKRRAITVAVLAIALFLLDIAEAHPHFIERYYSQSTYLVICRVLHPVFNLFPFSVGDVLYLLVIGLLVYVVIKLIRLLFKKQFKQAGILCLGIVIGVQIGLVAFYVLWGINYFRPPAAERLNLPDSNYTNADLAKLTKLFIDSANATRARVTAADLAQSNSTIKAKAIQAVQSLAGTSANFLTYSPGIKLSLFTPVINYLGTSGYYNPFTSESQMNYQMPVFLRPFVACHELSHQMGYGPEDEANFVGFLAAVRSPDRLMRYSAYHEAVDEFMRDVAMRDTVLFKQLKAGLSPAVHQDFKTEHLYWKSYEGPIDAISTFFYNDFLKANNQPHGMQTYNRMVRLVMAWYKKGEVVK